MHLARFFTVIFLILVVSLPATTGELFTNDTSPSLNQIEKVNYAYLSLSNDEFEYGDVFTVDFGFKNNLTEFVANITYELVIVDGNFNISEFSFSESNYTQIQNGTSTNSVETISIDTLPTDREPLIPNKYKLFLTSTLENSTNYNATEEFEIFPVEGANIDITFSDLNTNNELTSPVELEPDTPIDVEITLTNRGSGNAIDIFLITFTNSPLEVESASALSSGIVIANLNKFEQVSFNFTVNSPDFGIADIEFSLRYNRESGRTLEVSPVLVFHILPDIRGKLIAPDTIVTGQSVKIEVLIEHDENQNFTMKFFISSFTFTFQPIETQFMSVPEGLSKYNFNAITFTNGTFPASLFMTFLDPNGNEQINIELDQVNLNVITPEDVESGQDILTIILSLLYIILLIVIILVLLSNRVRRFVLDKLIQRTFIPDIDFSRKTAIIDGSNVAWEELDDQGKPKIENIILGIETLEKYGFEEIIVVADAALRYQIQNKTDLDKQSRKGKIKVLPAKVDGDSFILRLSKDTGALILTNDLYREYREEFNWIDKRRIPYSILNGSFYLHPIYDLD